MNRSERRSRLVFSCIVLIVYRLGTSAPRAEEAAVPDDQTLEASGAVIGTITIHAASIFDTENPDENKKVFRGANKLHVTTRERVIRRQLTFAPGDRYSRAALDESERHLRHTGYLYDAAIRPVRYEDGRVDVEVATRDVWTLRPAAGFHRSGGVNTLHFGLRDKNFLGSGRDVQIERVNGVDRTETNTSYTDPLFFGTHARMELGYSSNSDGSAKLFGFERPFWRLEEGWSAGVFAQSVDRTDPLYALGAVTDRFQEQWSFAEAHGGWRVGAEGRTIRRLLVGFTFDRSTFTALPGVTRALPPDRALSYPWFGVSLNREGYVRARDVDKMGRTEDFDMGWELRAKAGYATPALGADRSAGIFDLSWRAGFNPGAGQMLTLSTTAAGRIESDGLRDAQWGATARYYHRQGPGGLFFMSLSGAVAARLDPDHQLLLGGDNGLRGYPQRYALGDKSFLFTAEKRFYFDREFFHLTRVGAAAFLDIGKARSEDPDPAAHLGLLKDVGFGLRFGQTRSAHAGMVHVDIAVPLDGTSGGLHPQLVVTTGETF